MVSVGTILSFKPCYKRITFNTSLGNSLINKIAMSVLNLVINGLPSIQNAKELYKTSVVVLNLVINGLPSIQEDLLWNK